MEERISIHITIPKTIPDDNWSGWDLESFQLSEHLHDLIRGYGIEKLRESLNECEQFLKK